jgi:cation-dependent mannose-6-phosphate receptor
MLVLTALTLQSGPSNAAGGEKPDAVPCTIISPNTGSFYNLQPLALSLPDPDADHQPSSPAKAERWEAKGWDYKANFTLNICAPVIQDIKDVVGVDKAQWQSVSAYYTKGGETYSIG